MLSALFISSGAAAVVPGDDDNTVHRVHHLVYLLLCKSHLACPMTPPLFGNGGVIVKFSGTIHSSIESGGLTMLLLMLLIRMMETRKEEVLIKRTRSKSFPTVIVYQF